MGWNYLAIPKLQRLYRWSLGMDKSFHLTLYWACVYLFMLGLKLAHVIKSGCMRLQHELRGKSYPQTLRQLTTRFFLVWSHYFDTAVSSCATVLCFSDVCCSRCPHRCPNLYRNLNMWVYILVNQSIFIVHRVSVSSLNFKLTGLPTVTEFQYFVKEMRSWVRKFFWILAQNTEIFCYFSLIIAWKYWNFGKLYWKSWNYSKLLLK